MKVILSSKLHLNKAQLSALYNVLGKTSLAGTKVLFIIDAAADSPNNLPEWTQKDIDKFKLLGAEVLPYSLSENDQESHKSNILDSNILFFEGGSTPKLLQSIKDTQIMEMINSGVMEEKLWFGVSAGGCVLSPKCYSSCEKWFMENPGEQPIDGLTNSKSFYFIPHFNSKDFPLNTEKNLKYAQDKLKGCCSVFGTDNCVVTGTLKDNVFMSEPSPYDAFLAIK